MAFEYVVINNAFQVIGLCGKAAFHILLREMQYQNWNYTSNKSDSQHCVNRSELSIKRGS